MDDGDYNIQTPDGVVHVSKRTQFDEGPRYDWTYVRDEPIPQVTCLACIAAQAEYGPDE